MGQTEGLSWVKTGRFQSSTQIGSFAHDRPLQRLQRGRAFAARRFASLHDGFREFVRHGGSIRRAADNAELAAKGAAGPLRRAAVGNRLYRTASQQQANLVLPYPPFGAARPRLSPGGRRADADCAMSRGIWFADRTAALAAHRYPGRTL